MSMICLVPLSCIIRSSVHQIFSSISAVYPNKVAWPFSGMYPENSRKGCTLQTASPPHKKNSTLKLIQYFFLSKIHEKKGGVNCTLIVHHCLLECRKSLLYEKRSISLFYGFCSWSISHSGRLPSCFQNSIDRKTCFFVQLSSHNAD